MYRHIIEARKILTGHNFDKLMYKKERGVKPPTFADLVSTYQLERLLSGISLMLDQDLLDKIAALKQYIQATQNNYHQTLFTTCEVLEQKYRQSVADPMGNPGTIRTLINSLYGIRDPQDIKQNAGHKCPYRWYEFKDDVQPCINKQKASDTLQELNTLYRQRITLDLSDDCTHNGYEILDYIKQYTLPQLQGLSLPPQPLYHDPGELGYLLYKLKEWIRIVIDPTIPQWDKQEHLGQIVKTFNNLSNSAAYILSTEQTNYTFPEEYRIQARKDNTFLTPVLLATHDLRKVMRQLKETDRVMRLPENTVSSTTKWRAVIDRAAENAERARGFIGRNHRIRQMTYHFLEFDIFNIKVGKYKAAHGLRGGVRRRKTRKLRS
jgi:hypothetical protein